MYRSKNSHLRLAVVRRLRETGISPVDVAAFEEVNASHGKGPL